MKQKKEEQITITKTIYICDVCNDEVNHIQVCNICGKDICENCSVDDYTNIIDNDHSPDYYCKSCWDKGKEYRDEITRLKSKINTQYFLWSNDIIKPF